VCYFFFTLNLSLCLYKEEFGMRVDVDFSGYSLQCSTSHTGRNATFGIEIFVCFSLSVQFWINYLISLSAFPSSLKYRCYYLPCRSAERSVHNKCKVFEQHLAKTMQEVKECCYFERDLHARTCSGIGPTVIGEVYFLKFGMISLW
jgi:hypothetical protein